MIFGIKEKNDLNKRLAIAEINYRDALREIEQLKEDYRKLKEEKEVLETALKNINDAKEKDCEIGDYCDACIYGHKSSCGTMFGIINSISCTFGACKNFTEK